MGNYLNPGTLAFERAVNSEIYIDKTDLIKKTNALIYTEQCYICVSRPRRFGKSMTANMLSAYYGKDCDSKEMFSDLNISKDADFEKYLNKYNVIHLNMLDYTQGIHSVSEMIELLEEDLMDELEEEFGEQAKANRRNLLRYLMRTFDKTGIPFIFIIDEWDCIFRIYKDAKDEQTKYLDYIRYLLKDRTYVALAYMTGILPIKKYGRHSALNMFDEISMLQATPFTEFTGFTTEEVENLCDRYNMDYAKIKQWYDGYQVDDMEIFNPYSLVRALMKNKINNYWTQTETFEALKIYIKLNIDGLHDTIVSLLAGDSVVIDHTSFENDMVTFATKDDVLTLLVHLGYLTYNFAEKSVRIPNFGIADQFRVSIKTLGWEEVLFALERSEELLDSILRKDAKNTADLIQQIHEENTSILKYNDYQSMQANAPVEHLVAENSLSATLGLGLYTARNEYMIKRELPLGKGFADLTLIPRKHVTKPAIIVELKYDKDADSAIRQIHEKRYAGELKDYAGEVILAGINYDKSTKEYECIIE